METTTPFIAPKTIWIAFGGGANVLDPCTTTEKEGCGYTHPVTILTLSAGRTLDYLDG